MILDTVNISLFNWVYGLSHRVPLVDDLAVIAAQYLPYLMVLGFLLLVYDTGGSRRRAAFFLEAALAVLVARGIATEVIRFFFYHPRPFDILGFRPLVGESGSSFPSGHAAFFFALATIIYLFYRNWGWVYFALAAFNGASRVFAGVHWPLDIAGGALVGVLCAFLVHYFTEPYTRRLLSQPVPSESAQ